MSQFASRGEYPWRKRKETDKIWLASNFRVMLIKRGIDKAGSINKLGRELGYRSRVHPGWSIHQILLGRQAFPVERLKKLAAFLGYPFDYVMVYRASPREVTMESTRRALEIFGLHYYLPR